MKSYMVFYNVDENIYNEILKILFEYKSIHEQKNKGIKDRFEILTDFGSIFITYYTSNKLLIQSRSTNIVFTKLINEINRIVSTNIKKVEKDEKFLDEYKYYIGCDESGVGEAFGSMFLGCVAIEQINLLKLKSILGEKNVRTLNRNQILEILNLIQHTYDYRIKSYSAVEIDKYNKIAILDNGYMELISTILDKKSNCVIILDDYGIGSKFSKFIKSLRDKGLSIIVQSKADEMYISCKIASLIARYHRFQEIQQINSLYALVDPITHEKVFPHSGAANDPNTKRYLSLYKILNPNKEFPYFVRRKWKNIKKFNNM